MQEEEKDSSADSRSVALLNSLEKTEFHNSTALFKVIHKILHTCVEVDKDCEKISGNRWKTPKSPITLVSDGGKSLMCPSKLVEKPTVWAKLKSRVIKTFLVKRSCI